MRVKLYVFETICQSCATFYVCFGGVLYAPYNYKKQGYSTTSGCSSNRVTLICKLDSLKFSFIKI